MNLSKKSHFLNSASRFKAIYEKTMRFTQCKLVLDSVRKKIKMCNILVNTKYSAIPSFL